MDDENSAVAGQDAGIDRLQAENEELRYRLEEAEETIRAIESGAVDALVIRELEGHRIYTLEGADRPYRLMVEQMQQGAATLHIDGTIAYCNRRLSELLGVPHEKLVGSSLIDFIDADDRPTYLELLRQGRDSLGQGEARLRRPEGESIPAYLTFNVLPEDCGAATGVLVTDLTQQKHHEQLARTLEALKLSEKRFRSLVTATTSIVWTADAGGRLASEQDSWSAYTGQRAEEYLGFGWLDAVHPDDRETLKEEWDEARRDNTLFKADPRIWHAETGAYRHVEIRGVPVFDARGGVREWIGRCMDMEAQVQTEIQMFKLMADLKEADQRKSTFLAMLSHELRNPMAPILNALQLLEEGNAGAGLTGEAHEVIGRQVRHLSRLVDDLLEVSRISTGRIRLHLEHADLNAVVKKTVEGLGSLIADHRQTLDLSLPEEPVWIQADVIRLEQVIGNLLRNASKYNHPGGRIWLSVEKREGRAVLQVQDNGIGITDQLMPQIFDLFTQADTSLDHSEGGLGVGLALVKNLVESHGGTVDVRSEGLGKGSKFTVRLPLAAGMPARQDAATARSVAPVAASLRILIVDDLVDMARMTAMLLESWGHEVQVSHDGIDALQRMEGFMPHVVLLDIGMPGMDGYEVAGRIRSQSRLDGVRLVAISGYGQADDRQRAMEAGFDVHLTKPVEPDDLKRVLAECLRKELG